MLDSLFKNLYRALFFPLLLGALKILSLFNPKIRKGLEIRKNNPWMNIPANLKNPILIHCASGEFEYAKSVIREIKNKSPQTPVVVTYFSPTYENQIKNFPGIDFSCPFPWDFPKTQKEFLEKLRPKQILFARTDLWPEFLIQAQQLKIPTKIFSATLSSQNPKIKNPFIKAYSKWIFAKLAEVFCVAEDDKKNFSELLPADKIIVAGDTRYDQVVHRILNPKALKDILKPKQQALVIGSSWNEDEDQLFPIFGDLIRNQIAVIIAPHEPTPHHLSDMKADLQELAIPFQLYSEAESFDSQSVLIIDEVGILADLYGWATWAFVGGSFKKSVHSVMEPLAHGCVTYFGPYYLNNREAIEFKEMGLATSAKNGTEILKDILDYRKETADKRQKILEKIHQKTGGSKLLVEKTF